MKRSPPHDPLIRRVFGRAHEAAGLLRHLLPGPVASHLDLNALEVVPGSFLDPALKRRSTDLLFRVPTTARGEVFVYVLLEHQSTPDHWMALRVTTYLERIWAHLRRAHPRRRTLPRVLPLVLYTGQRPWRCAEDLADLFDGPDTESSWTPHVRYALKVLSRESDADLAAWHELSALGRLTLFLLQAIRAHDFMERLRAFVQPLAPAPVAGEDLLTLVIYTTAVRDDVVVEEVVDILDTIVIPRSSREVRTSLDRLLFESFSNGREEGREEGFERGRRAAAEALLRQGLARFGALSEGQDAVLAAADEAALLRCFNRLFVAQTLEEVLAELSATS